MFKASSSLPLAKGAPKNKQSLELILGRTGGEQARKLVQVNQIGHIWFFKAGGKGIPFYSLPLDVLRVA